jgi:molybdopterin converting factor small subunit
VTVRLYGELARFSGGRGYEFTWPLRAGQTVGELLKAIGVPGVEVWMVAINGTKVGLDATPAPGDEVGVFSPVGGG